MSRLGLQRRPGWQRGLVSLAVKLAARVRWAQRWATIACKACHRCFLGEVSGAVGPRRPLPEGLRAVIGARAGLGDCAAAMVRAHRHGTARLGALVAHLLDQSRIFGGWSTVARGGRGLRVRLHLLACQRSVTGEQRRATSESVQLLRRSRVAAADYRVDCSAV